LQDWYGKELASYTNEEDLSKVTQEYLEDESKINQFFEK
jgi:hypothetical protein